MENAQFPIGLVILFVVVVGGALFMMQSQMKKTIQIEENPPQEPAEKAE